MLTIGDKVQVVDFTEKRHIGKLGTIFLIRNGLGSHSQPVGEYQKIPQPKIEHRYNVELDEGTKLNDLKEQQLRKVNYEDIIKLTETGESLAVHLAGARLGYDNGERIDNVARRLVCFVLEDYYLELTEEEQDQLVSESIEIISANYGDKLRGTFLTKEAARITIIDEIERLKIKYSLK